MKKTNVEKLLKRFLKRKTRITLATVICFLLSSYGLQAKTINLGKDEIISENQNYTENTTITKNEGQVIWNKDKTPIKIEADDNILEIKHTATNYFPYDDNTDVAYATSIGTVGGDITVNAGKIDVNTYFPDTSITGSGPHSGSIIMSYAGDNNVNDSNKIMLNAGDIILTGEGKGSIYGITIAGDNSDNAKENNQVIVTSENFTIDVKNNDNADKYYEVQGIRADIGKVTVNSTNVIINTTATGNAAADGLYTEKDGEINITATDKIEITSIVGEDSWLGNTSIRNNGIMNLLANTISLTGTVMNSSGTLNLSGNNIFFTSDEKNRDNVGIISEGTTNIITNGTLHVKTSGAVDMFYENGTVGIHSTGGITTINSGNTIIENTTSGWAIKDYSSAGIQAEFGGKIIVNGGLEIRETNNREMAALYARLENSTIDINNENKGVLIKLDGNLRGEAGGVINLNLNGENSYLNGNSTIEGENSQINLGLSNKARWENTKDSHVTNLTFNNGIIDMSYSNGHQRIDIDNVSGNNGTIIMDISADENKTDFISMKNADELQEHTVEAGKGSIDELKDHDFSNGNSILIGEADKDITLKGGKFIDNGNIFDYELELGEEGKLEDENLNNWYVTGIKGKEGSVIDDITDDLALLYMNAAVSRLELDTIHERLGEIRNYNGENGVWFRTVAGNMEHKNSSIDNDYNMIQVGYDKQTYTENGRWFTGIAVSRRENKTDFKNGDGEGINAGVSLYRSFAGKNNSYLDFILKYNYIDNEFESYNSKNQKMKADYDTWAGTFSTELGKKFSKSSWYVTPHVQMNYTHINGADYTTTSGVKAEQDNIDSLIGKIGVYAGKDFEKSSHYIKAGVLHEFSGDYGARITGADNSIHKKINGEDSWIEIGLGGNIQFGDSGTTHMYYDFEKTFESDFDTDWQVTLGLRFSFNKLSDIFKK